MIQTDVGDDVSAIYESRAWTENAHRLVVAPLGER